MTTTKRSVKGSALSWAEMDANMTEVDGKALLAGSASQAFSALSLDIGHASDTTLTRVSAGVAAIEGNNILTATASQRIQITRDMTAAGGNVAYTGIGFTPKSLIAFAAIDGQTGWSHGTSSGTVETNFVKLGGGATATNITSTLIYGSTDASGNDNQNAVIASLDSDGFTLTWAKGGTPTGTMTVDIVAFK